MRILIMDYNNILLTNKAFPTTYTLKDAFEVRLCWRARRADTRGKAETLMALRQREPLKGLVLRVRRWLVRRAEAIPPACGAV